MTSTPHRATYTVTLKPQMTDESGHLDHGTSMRRAVVRATGEEGESGYPRYVGDGFEVDIDPRTRAVEAATVDGLELPYGWVAEAEVGAADE
ncbi:hypothetical protein AB0J21_21955 [Streptomyces sp. NPDC049954]|uniref:hypothetical protein n=1 Tax=Streptomyces sp. NPDC049954 TaxID=3155779 RepID=UPI00342A5C55